MIYWAFYFGIAKEGLENSCDATYKHYVPEYWSRKLSYPVVPRSGPLRPTRTLGEARKTITERLPADALARSGWTRAMVLLSVAGASGRRGDIREATDQMMRALEREGWLR